MRRVFALLLVTPLLVNCSDSATPVAPAASASEVVTDGRYLFGIRDGSVTVRADRGTEMADDWSTIVCCCERTFSAFAR